MTISDSGLVLELVDATKRLHRRTGHFSQTIKFTMLNEEWKRFTQNADPTKNRVSSLLSFPYVAEASMFGTLENPIETEVEII